MNVYLPLQAPCGVMVGDTVAETPWLRDDSPWDSSFYTAIQAFVSTAPFFPTPVRSTVTLALPLVARHTFGPSPDS